MGLTASAFRSIAYSTAVFRTRRLRLMTLERPGRRRAREVVEDASKNVRLLSAETGRVFLLTH
jgi:hypothetical protein